MANPIPPKKIIKSLKSKGFILEEGKNHKLLRFCFNGQKTSISTSLSRGSSYREYGQDLLKLMSKGLRLEKMHQLINLIECPLKQKEYTEILIRGGFLSS